MIWHSVGSIFGAELRLCPYFKEISLKRKILLIFLSIILILPSAPIKADEINSVDEVVEAYKNLLGRDTLNWLINMYDYKSGGFHYSQSAKDNPDKYAPIIESINWAIDGLRGCGIIENGSSIPQPVKEKFVSFVKERRGGDGYYYDYYAPEDRLYTEAEDMKKGRDLSAARGILSICGVSEDSLLNEAAASLMSFEDKNLSDITDEDEFSSWIRVKFPFTLTPYQDASTLAANKAYITEKGWDDTLAAYLVEIQKEDGLWGDDREEIWAKNNRINAALKNCAWFQRGGTSYPRLSEMVESVLYAFENYEMPASLCESWNRLELIRCAFLSYETIPSEIQSKLDQNLLSMLKACLKEIENFKMADGGYAMYKDGGTGLSQRFPVCEAGKAEGDMNAFAVIRDYIRTVHLLAGKGEPKFSNPEDSAYFWAKILEKHSDHSDVSFYQGGECVEEISGGELLVSANVYALSDTEVSVICAIYDDKLCDIKITRGEIKGGAEKEISCKALNVPKDASLNAYAKVMVWKEGTANPFSVAKHAFMKGSGDITAFKVNNINCDINTDKKIIYVESENGESIKGEAEIFFYGNAGYRAENKAEGFISDGDRYILLSGDGLEKKVYTVKIEKAPKTSYLSTFDAGYRESNCPSVNEEGDAGMFDMSGLSFVSIANDNGNNVLQIDKTESGGQCNLHRFYPVEDSDKYIIEYKFNLISSSGDYLFHNNLFANGISPKTSTWDNSSYENYKDYFVEPGKVLIGHSAFTNTSKIALLNLGQWNKIRVVMRKLSPSKANYEIYINDKFVYSADGSLKFTSGESVKMLLIEDTTSAKYKIQYDDMIFAY